MGTDSKREEGGVATWETVGEVRRRRGTLERERSTGESDLKKKCYPVTRGV